MSKHHHTAPGVFTEEAVDDGRKDDGLAATRGKHGEDKVATLERSESALNRSLLIIAQAHFCRLLLVFGNNGAVLPLRHPAALVATLATVALASAKRLGSNILEGRYGNLKRVGNRCRELVET